MSADLTAVVVAVVGVAGTMTAPLLAERARRRASAEEAAQAERRRREDRDEQELERRRGLYAALNSAARAYRTAAQDAALALGRGEAADLSALEAARSAYQEQYAQAQMVLPDRPLTVASEVNRCLGLGYRLVRTLPEGEGRAAAAARAEAWFERPLADAVWLLRQALREDLGVVGGQAVPAGARESLKASRRRIQEQLAAASAGTPADGQPAPGAAAAPAAAPAPAAAE